MRHWCMHMNERVRKKCAEKLFCIKQLTEKKQNLSKVFDVGRQARKVFSHKISFTTFFDVRAFSRNIGRRTYSWDYLALRNRHSKVRLRNAKLGTYIAHLTWQYSYRAKEQSIAKLACRAVHKAEDFFLWKLNRSELWVKGKAHSAKVTDNRHNQV